MEPSSLPNYVAPPPPALPPKTEAPTTSQTASPLQVQPSAPQKEVPSPPLTSERVTTNVAPEAAPSALFTAEAVEEGGFKSTQKSLLLLQALDRPSEPIRQVDLKPSDELTRPESNSNLLLQNLNKAGQSDASPLEMAKFKLNQAEQALKEVEGKVQTIEKELNRNKKILGLAQNKVIELRDNPPTTPEEKSKQVEYAKKLKALMESLNTRIAQGEDNLDKATEEGMGLHLTHSEAESEYLALANPKSTSTSEAPPPPPSEPARRAGFTAEDLRSFTQKTHTRTELPKLQKKATAAALPALDPWRDPEINLAIEEGKLRVNLKPTKEQTTEAVNKMFEIITSENKTGQDLEKILNYLQTNKLTSRVIQDNSELRKELRTHLQKLSNEDKLLYLKNQVILLRDNPKFKLTSTKDGLVYLVPTSKFGFDFRKGASKEAKEAVAIILKQIEDSAEELPDLTGDNSRKMSANLTEMKKTIGGLNNVWWSATVTKHKLDAEVKDALNKVSVGFSKLSITKENIVEKIISLSSKDTVDMGNVLRVYRLIDMSSDELFNQLSSKLKENPHDKNLNKQVFTILSAWFADRVVNQGEWKVLNGHELLTLLPSGNEDNLDWKELKSAIAYQAASQEVLTPQSTSPSVNPYSTFSSFKDNSVELQEFNRLMQGQGREQFLNSLVVQLNNNDQKLFSQLNANEFKGQAWTKSNKEVTSPTIVALAKNFNSNWTFVMAAILSQPDSEKRTQSIKFFLDLCVKLKESGNFNSTYSIFAGINSSLIRNLPDTKLLMEQDPKYKAIRDDLENLVSPSKSSAALRKALDDRLPKPSIPYLGIYLTDLVFLSESSTKGVMQKGQAEIYSKIMNNVLNAVDFPAQTSPSDFKLNNLIAQVPNLTDDVEIELEAAAKAAKSQL